MKAHFEAINKATRSALEVLKKSKIADDFYLAGGTGLAFMLGHRESRDLDFFRKEPFNEKRLVEHLRRVGGFSLEKRELGTVLGQLLKVRVSFFHYPYLFINRLEKMAGVHVASVRDIGCMKLDALSARGAKRDFVDIYSVVTKTPNSLYGLLRAYRRKYVQINPNIVHIKKSLVYFSDAESDPMPKVLTAVSWKEIKDFFIKEVKKL